LVYFLNSHKTRLRPNKYYQSLVDLVSFFLCELKMHQKYQSMIKLTGPNCPTWNPKMEYLLYCKDLYYFYWS